MQRIVPNPVIACYLSKTSFVFCPTPSKVNAGILSILNYRPSTFSCHFTKSTDNSSVVRRDVVRSTLSDIVLVIQLRAVLGHFALNFSIQCPLSPFCTNGTTRISGKFHLAHTLEFSSSPDLTVHIMQHFSVGQRSRGPSRAIQYFTQWFFCFRV